MADRIRSRNIEKVAQAIFSGAEDRESFLCAIEDGDSGITAVAWLASSNKPRNYRVQDHRPAWLPSWIDIADVGERPGILPEHEAGDFYLLDLSSTFALAPLERLGLQGGVLIDVCAAPGGKGILARRYCNPDAIIGNEVIRKRTAQLIANYKRCSIDPALITSCDPKLLARLLPAIGSLVVVDAPCSGQSLVLKDLAAPGAFHPATIAMNERRQRRILAESSKLVSPGGYLLYSTCTFSPEENEHNIEWFCKSFPQFSTVEVENLREYRSELSSLASYRLFPQSGFGAGAFCCFLRRAGEIVVSQSLSARELTGIIRPVWASESVGCTPALRNSGKLNSERSATKRQRALR